VKVVASAEMRRLEAAAEALGLPGPALMEIAGRAFADAVVSLYGPLRGRRVVVCCGPGNNGGDGLVAARWLADAGARPLVLLAARRASDDAKQMLLAELGVPCLRVGEAAGALPPAALPAALAGAAVVVDALLGIGRARPIGGAMAAVLAAAAESGAPIVALDVPSGLDADSGRADPATPRCDATVTLGAVKRGLLIGDGPGVTGRLLLQPIGIPAACADNLPVDWLGASAVAALLPPRPVTGHKALFGRVLVVAGSAQYLGAPLLAALGAARGGAGLVTLAAPGAAGQVAAARAPEITHLPLPGPSSHLTPAALEALAEAAEGYRAAIVGPGLGRHPETDQLLRAILADRRLRAGPRWIVDADALTLLSRVPDWPALLPEDAILTPHAGEMARLLAHDEPPLDRLAAAVEAAGRWRTNLVLKGAYTVVAGPQGGAGVSPGANPALGTAGTGDVLTGAIAALIAQGARPLAAARAGVVVHAIAGELARRARGAGGVLAGDVADLLPAAAELLRAGRDPWAPASARIDD
jgi:hydroxyethylthiazole kinase-like uncharacterized protein yjeF